MSWEFTEDAAFLALCDAYKESGEPSAMEFLAHGEGAFHFQELTQNAAGEGIDLSDSSNLEEFQQEVIDALEDLLQLKLRSRKSNLLSFQAIPSGGLKPGIKAGLVEMLRACLDDAIAHRFLDTAAGPLAFQIHHLRVESDHLGGDRGAIQVDARGDCGINAARSGNGHSLFAR